MSDRPDVSVVIPAHNAAATLAETLDSVERQSLAPDEVLVVDDGSTDDTPRLAAAHRLAPRCLIQVNGGPSAARNAGWRTAAGRYVAFLDADDVWPADALAALFAHFDHQAAAQVALGTVRDWWPGGGIARPSGHRFNLGSALFRREVFDIVGGFDILRRTGEDVEFWVRLRHHGIRVDRLEHVTLHYRRRPATQRDRLVFTSNLAQTLKQSLDRGRRAA
jgi:glycosyltransferase involved in cell wall biosynthesis